MTGPPAPGAERALANADDWWRSSAERAVRVLAATGRPFTAFDLVDHCGVTEPDSSARWGGLFRRAAQQGVIEPTGAEASRRPTRAGSLCRVWRGTATFREQHRREIAAARTADPTGLW